MTNMPSDAGLGPQFLRQRQRRNTFILPSIDWSFQLQYARRPFWCPTPYALAAHEGGSLLWLNATTLAKERGQGSLMFRASRNLTSCSFEPYAAISSILLTQIGSLRRGYLFADQRGVRDGPARPSRLI